MNTSQPGPPYLRDVLADRYHRWPDAERIVRGVGLEVARIAWDRKPINTWESILDEAQSRGLMEALIDLLLQEAPASDDLQQAIRAYRESGLTYAAPVIESRLTGRHDFYRHIPLPPNYIPHAAPPETGDLDDPDPWLESYAAGVGFPLELRFLRLFKQHGLHPQKHPHRPGPRRPVHDRRRLCSTRAPSGDLSGRRVGARGDKPALDRLIRQRLASASPP